MELPVAEPNRDAVVALVAEAFVSPEYVYLLRVATPLQPLNPKAKIPTVEFPAADP